MTSVFIPINGTGEQTEWLIKTINEMGLTARYESRVKNYVGVSGILLQYGDEEEIVMPNLIDLMRGS